MAYIDNPIVNTAVTSLRNHALMLTVESGLSITDGYYIAQIIRDNLRARRSLTNLTLERLALLLRKTKERASYHRP